MDPIRDPTRTTPVTLMETVHEEVRNLFEEVADIGTKPGLIRRAAATLINEVPLPFPTADALRDQATSFEELRLVA